MCKSFIHMCGIICICAHHSFLCRTWLCESDTSLLMCVSCACVRVCHGVCVRECNTNLKRWPVYIVCGARVYIYICVCLCLFVLCRRPTTRTSHEFAPQMWKVHKNNVREMGKVPSPPSEVFSRNGLFSSLYSCFYCHTHTRASICTCSQLVTCTRRTF